MSLNTRVWQQEQGKPIFRFQTEDERDHILLSQQPNIELVGWGVNFKLWIYIGKFKSLRQARNSLSQVGLNREHEPSY